MSVKIAFSSDENKTALLLGCASKTSLAGTVLIDKIDGIVTIYS
jgi:hypothetical protein